MAMSAFLFIACLCFAAEISGSYIPRRSVVDFGAKGDGITDDTDAIIRAITKGRGDEPGASYPTVYSSSSLTPALVYFPPGVYLITSTLPLIYYTQLVGDADRVPTIKARSTNEPGMRIVDSLSDKWGGGLVNQNNFFHQVRNFILDMTECSSCTGIHWQVAQATQLSNIHFKMKKGSDSLGIWMDNGSGGFMSDLVFDGGLHGLWIGNQQFTSRNITIRGASASGVYLNWDWSWVFKSLSISDCPIGIDVADTVGSLTLIDSIFSDIAVAAVRTAFNSSDIEVSVNNLVLDNVAFTASPNSGAVVVLNGGAVALDGSSTSDGGSAKVIRSWVQGRVWQNGETVVQTRDLAAEGLAPPRPLALVSGSPDTALKQSEGLLLRPFFEMRRPDFDSTRYTRVNAVRDLGILNDGSEDVTDALQKALMQCATDGSVLFLPHGTYLITNTLYVPPGSRVLGEAWSVIMVADNSNGVFSNPATPVAAIKVGREGEQGVAQLVDLLVTTRGPVPGAKLVEWNMADPPGQPGSTGMWEVHFRVGGAIGTKIDPSNCPRGDGHKASAADCAGAWALMHITKSTTAYLENVWGWVADHDLDYDDQINVYNARGLLVESQGPVWMYGTSFEHSLLYQYNLHGARNVLMALIQTETPYFQPSPHTPFLTSPPSQSTVLAQHATDPEFCTDDSRCDMSLGLVVQAASADVYLYGSGLYSFFNMWDQSCLHSSSDDGDSGASTDHSDYISPDCQLEIARVSADSKMMMFNHNTYGSVYMTTQDEGYSAAADNRNTFCSTAAADLTHILQR